MKYLIINLKFTLFLQSSLVKFKIIHNKLKFVIAYMYAYTPFNHVVIYCTLFSLYQFISCYKCTMIITTKYEKRSVIRNQE